MQIGARAVVSAVIVLLAVATSHADVAVTSCGQVVPRKTTGFLTGDLDSSGSGTVGVVLLRRARLDLGGYTLTGGSGGVLCEPDPNCDPSIGCLGSGRCEVVNGTVAGGEDGITAGRVTLTDVTLRDSTRYAVLALTRIDASNVHAVGAPHALQATRKIIVTGSLLENGDVQARRVLLDSTTVTGVRALAVLGDRIMLVNHTAVTGNGTSSRCGTEIPCADLATTLRPKVDATSTCERSVKIEDFTQTWGVCSLD